MKRIIAVLAAFAILGGCASWTPKPPPESAPPPPEEEPSDEPKPEDPPPPVEKPPDKPVEPAPKPPRQEIPGMWLSKAALGPGSAPVRRVEMIFEMDGGFAGTMLLEAEKKKRFVSLDGTWVQEGSKITVKYSNGNTRTWGFSWDGGVLILKDGEAELRLERAPE